MSPLWSDRALAQAAWANAVDLGLVERTPIRRPANDTAPATSRDVPRRPIRRPVSSIAL
jgi:hypothetical protein